MIPHDAYAEAIVAEARRRSEEVCVYHPLDSLYFGGGTPGMWSPESVSKAIQGVMDVYGGGHGVEITLEFNPENGDLNRLEALRDAGVNRLSIGAQSFQDDHLRALGRLHSSDHIHASVMQARRAGFENISLDLIHGIAGQTLADCRADVRAAMALGVEHVSFYQLTIESGTSFGVRSRRGERLLRSDAMLVSMYSTVRQELMNGGYRPYEVSSAARPGFESRHNHVYWTGGQYVGLGAGAHGFLKMGHFGVRWSNLKKPEQYLNRVREGEFPESERTRIDAQEWLEDRVMLALRMDRGITVDSELRQCFGGAAGQLVEDGLLIDDGQHWRVTDRGRLLLDTVVFRLVDG